MTRPASKKFLAALRDAREAERRHDAPPVTRQAATHKWKWSPARSGRGECLRCGVRTRPVKGPKGGVVMRWSWNDGTHDDTNKTPPCSGHLDAKETR